MVLELKNITKYYNDNKVLDNVNIKLKKGKLLCLLGTSGCGKTTLLNVVAGFIDDFSGEIMLHGEKINNKKPENRKIAMVFQSYALFSHKNVYDNIAYGLKFRKISKKEVKTKVEDILEKINLRGYEKKKIFELSGGEQQRVAIARALIVEPSILLLDEPFSNLDINLRKNMREEIKRLQKKFEITMIVVTHDREDAFEIADEIAVMNKGKIEQIGTVRKLYETPKTEFVANFLGEGSVIRDKYTRCEKIILEKNFQGKGIIISKKFKGKFIEYKVKYLESEISSLVLNSGKEEFSEGDKVDIKLI